MDTVKITRVDLPDNMREGNATIADYPLYTALIHFTLNGVAYQWAIGAHPKVDTEDSLRAHLARWIPGAVFVRAEIQ